MNLLAKLRTWLIKRLLAHGVIVEVEARHGAIRTRSRMTWKGQLLRVDIPLQQRRGVTSSPLGEIEDPQKLIDSATAAHHGNAREACPMCNGWGKI